MTKAEAIEQLQNCIDLIKQDGQDYLDDRDIPLLYMAIEALQAEPNCKRCAIKELWQATEKENLVAVVRCKDCKSSRVYGKTTHWLACEDVMEGQATDPDGYCYLGERRE